LSPVIGGERFASDVVNAAVPLNDGALITTASHLYRLSSRGVEPFSTAGDSYLTSNLAYSMQILPGGEIGVGTRKGGLVLLSRDGAVDRILSTANGLPDDWVSEMHVDPQGGVWLAQNNGITRFNPGLSMFGKNERLEGDVEHVVRHEGALYVGTTAGLFRMKAQPGSPPQFESIDGVNSTVEALMPYAKDLLVATESGVFLATGNNARRIFESTRPAYFLSVSLRDPDTVYVARHRCHCTHTQGFGVEQGGRV
jgi:hypothetical protein